MTELNDKPWTRGPFELIRHAHGHMQAGGDTDRRIAIIGFDNAIEVCIDVFLKLHPWLRDGLQITKEDVQKATNNYYSKIEFLDKHVQSKNLSLDVPILPIVWFHSLRNELYHSGNGMVPEMHVLEGAQVAALSVFKALFGIDASPLLNVDISKPADEITSLPYIGQNPEMDYLRVFIDFETKLRTALSGSVKDDRITPMALWRQFASRADVPKEWNEIVQEAMQFRNSIAHGRTEGISEEKLSKIATSLQDITTKIDKYTWGKIDKLE